MKHLLHILFSLILTYSTTAQEWSEPVNVSNMEGIDYFPDFCIDQDGIIHCVWSHNYGGSLIKVFYSKSEDEGTTWSEAEDISQNIALWCLRPHIVANSENHLFVSYDYDTYSTTQNLVVMKKYDGNAWSDADTVSEGMPGAKKNTLSIDHNDRVYCFWYVGTNTGHFSYRFLENNTWSEIFSPYSDEYHF